jgi:outer membrane lipoprotein SlyB
MALDVPRAPVAGPGAIPMAMGSASSRRRDAVLTLRHALRWVALLFAGGILIGGVIGLCLGGSRWPAVIGAVATCLLGQVWQSQLRARRRRVADAGASSGRRA